MKNLLSKKEFLNEKNSINENASEIQNYISLVDYTQLDPAATEEDIAEICNKAKQYGVATICILPKMVKFGKQCLEGSNVGVCTVVSFPEGTDTLEQKIAETKQVLADGADEVDMVLDYNKLKENWIEGEEDLTPVGLDIYESLVDEVQALTELCHADGKILKVIVESGLLTGEQTKVTTDICKEAGADFIKTSTGKVDIGAELDKVKIMYDNADGMKIKASGGIRTLEDIKTFAPYVDRFGVGYGSIDSMMGVEGSDSSY